MIGDMHCKDMCHKSVIMHDYCKKQVQNRKLTLDSTSSRGKDKSQN